MMGLRRGGVWATLALAVLAACGAPVGDSPERDARASGPRQTQSQAMQTHSEYFSDFEGGAGPEWSDRTVSVTPAGGRHFLGPFMGKEVSLTLSDLPTHELVTVSFDLFIIGSWEGNNPVFGPDVFDVHAVGGSTLLHTTFSNDTTVSEEAFWQAYPNSYPEGRDPPLTGAAERGTLGYPPVTSPYTGVGDSVYRLSITFPHDGDTLDLRFADLPRSNADEMWGLDNVRVTVNNNNGGDTHWVHTFNVGSFFGSTIRRVAYDRDGNLLVLGDLRGPIEGLPVTPPTVARPGMFLARFGREGDLKWVRGFDVVPGSFPPMEEDEPTVRGRAVTADRDGNIIITGVQKGDVDFGGGPRSGASFVAKFDKDGHHLWSRSYGSFGGGGFEPAEVATDSSGDIILQLVSLSGVDLGGGILTPPAGTEGSALVKLSPSGSFKWVHFAMPPLRYYSGLAVDSNEQLYSGGALTEGSVPFLEKLSPKGERRWLRLLEGARGGIANVAVGGSRVAVTGSLVEPYSFPGFTFRGEPGVLARPGDFGRGFLAVFSTSGDKRWARAAGTGFVSVGMDSYGGVAVGGSFYTGDDLGFGPVFATPPGLNNYVSKYDSDDGDTRWVRLVPLVRDLASARDGRVGVGGVFTDTVDFGEGPVTGGEGANLYLLDIKK